VSFVKVWNARSLSLFVLFLSFVFGGSQAYSQCSLPIPTSPTSLVVAAGPSTGTQPTITPNVNKTGLIGYWKFDEGTGTTTCDHSGSSNNGTLVKGPLWTAGKLGKALYFDGIDDTVTVVDSNSLDLSSAFTLSAWVNPAVTSTSFSSILVKNYKYFLYASATGYCGDGSLLAGVSEGANQPVCQASPLPANTWTHLALTSNGSALTLYRNGIAVATANVSGNLSPSTGNLQIGASQFGEYFRGLIDEVRIYNRALSAADVQIAYKQESAETSQIVATPLIAPVGGSHSGPLLVTMQTATSAASIHYTTNGSTPTQSSALYSAPLSLTSSTTLKAKAFKSGYTDSGETSAAFTVTMPFNFSLANTGDKSVTAGASVTNSISSTLVSGATQAVSFSVSGLPSGIVASFSSTSCSPNCSTVLDVNTGSTAPAGTYNVTVTATGGNMSKTTTFALTILLGVSTPPPPPATGNGNVYYVSTSGNDGVSCSTAQNTATPKRTINNAVNCLQAGDTLYIRGGIYTERVNITSVFGTATAPVTIAGYPSDSRPIVRPGASSDPYVWMVQYDQPQTPRYLTIRFIEIDDSNYSAETAAACMYLGTPHVTIENVTLRNCSGNGFQLFSSNLTVRNSLVLACGRIQNLDAADTKGIGFYIAPPAPANVNPSAYAKDNLWENNIVDGCRGGGGVIHYGRSDNNIIRNSIFKNAGSYSPWPWPAGARGFRNASGINLGGEGFYNPGGPRFNKIYNNLFINLKHELGAGHFLWGAHDNTIVNNTYYNVDVLYQITCPGGNDRYVIQNNIVAEAASGRLDTGCTDGITGTISNNLLNPDVASTFVDAANGNFNLKNGGGAGATISP
jgi:hypothetical protein